LHRLVFFAWCATSVSLAGWALSGCRHYENITDIYTEPPPPDASPGGRGGGAGGAGGGRLPPAPIAGVGGPSGTGGDAGNGGAGTGGTGGSGPAPDAQPGAEAGTVVPPPVDTAPPAPPPDTGPPPVNSMTLGQGLVSRWKLDEGAGTTALDTGGSGNIGVVAGASWEASGFPAAKYTNRASLRFDGGDSYVELGTRGLPANNRPQSVSVWFSFGAAPPAMGRLVLVSLTAGPGGPSRLKLGFKEGQVGAWRSGTPGDLAIAMPPSPGWHHLAYTFDGTTHRLFLDGVQRGMSTAAADTGAVLRARLGANFDSTERFVGQIDDVRVYGRALTAEEVAALNAGFE
jgi:hypothetical protein